MKELQSIVNYGIFSPAVSPTFNTNCVADTTTVLTGSCTATSYYWSSTAAGSLDSAEFAWGVEFGGGNVVTFDKCCLGDFGVGALHVRAVRGGSP